MEITWSLPRTEGSPRESPRPTSPASPSTTLSNPQGAGLHGPAASSNSSYVPCHQLLCAGRLSTPARHIRSYPFWVKHWRRGGPFFSSSTHCAVGDFPQFTHITCIFGLSPLRATSG